MDGIPVLAVVLILLIILAIIGVGIVLLLRKRVRAPEESRPEAPRDPFHSGDQDALRGDPRVLKAGDIVEVRGHAYTVRGSLRLSEGAWSWSEHLLDDAKGTQLWLSVEEDPDLVLALWRAIEDSDPQAGDLHPGADTIDYADRSYESEESGTANFRSEATTGLEEQGTVRYHDYEAPDGSMLGFESYGDAGWETSTGEELSRYDVRIYPA